MLKVLRTSTFANSNSLARWFTFKASDLVIEPKKAKVELPEDLQFGKHNTHNMVMIDFEGGKWKTPRIVPFEDIKLHPFSSSLHYAISCFEGLKAYKDAQGNKRMFRPLENMKRFQTSCSRLMLPDFDPNELLKILDAYVQVEHEWIPRKKGWGLYLRPFAYSTDNVLGVKPSTKSRIQIVSSPVGSYFEGGSKPWSLGIVREYQRGSPKSAAGFKISSNYGPTIKFSGELAIKEKFDQVLWVDGDNILEVGACNIFFLLKTPNGETELATAPLDGSILPGITRKSILELEREKKRFKVSERYVTVTELKQAFKEDRVVEIFGAGTAVTVLPVGSLSN